MTQRFESRAIRGATNATPAHVNNALTEAVDNLLSLGPAVHECVNAPDPSYFNIVQAPEERRVLEREDRGNVGRDSPKVVGLFCLSTFRCSLRSAFRHSRSRPLRNRQVTTYDAFIPKRSSYGEKQLWR